MTSNEKNRVCPVEHAGALDSKARRLFQNPQRMLQSFISEGDTVLDLGCGPGFFSIELAKMVGFSGKVIAADLQAGMLEKLNKKIEGTGLQSIIELHKCQKDRIGIATQFDFILLFYILHEIVDQAALFKELKTLLKPGGKILIVEPKFHVSNTDFNDSVRAMKNTGFAIIEGPGIFFSRSVVLQKS